jgi:SAM-dependent methyltransferase
MHKANRMFLDYFKNKYPRYSSGNISVIEFGSLNINGSIREFIQPVKEYIGIDWREGKDVDLVSLAHNINLNRQFDVVVSASMLEHDPYWDKTLESMILHLKEDGLLYLSWGTAYSVPHCLDTAPDGGFHSLKVSLVLNKLKELGIQIHEFYYECNLYPPEDCRHKDGKGEVQLIAFKNLKNAIGPSIINQLYPLDY